MFDRIFQHLMENNLLNPNQSGFMPDDSCRYINLFQLPEIYVSCASTNPSFEVRGVFRYSISKALNRVWREGLIYKTKCMAVTGDLLTLIESFLFERQQSVVLNGEKSSNQTWCASGFNSLVHYFLQVI